MKIVNIKGAAVAAVSLTALLAVSACSGGGAAPTSASSGGGGGNSGYTFAMYPCPPDKPLPIARRTYTYLASCL